MFVSTDPTEVTHAQTFCQFPVPARAPHEHLYRIWAFAWALRAGHGLVESRRSTCARLACFVDRSKMSARGGKSQKRARAVSRSAKAGLQFPESRVHCYLRQCTHHFRIAAGAPVYQAAVMEYLCPRGWGVLIIFLGGGVPPGPENHYPISDLTLKMYTLFQTLWCVANSATLNRFTAYGTSWRPNDVRVFFLRDQCPRQHTLI